MNPIDKNSPIPIYYQIESDLRSRILQGEFKPNEQLPSEALLTKYYDISRMTLRQAMAELEKDGLISRFRGKGAFVCEQPAQFLYVLDYALGSESSPDVKIQLLDFQIAATALPMVYGSLKLTPNDPVIYLKRLFTFESKPLALGKSWLPASLLPNLTREDAERNTLARLAERYRLNPTDVNDILEVVRPSAEEKELLGASYDTPLILIKGLSLLDGKQPFEYSHTLWLGNRTRFQFSLKKTDGKFMMHSDPASPEHLP